MNLLILTNNLNRASFRQRIAVYLDTLRRNGIDYEIAQLPSGTLARRKLFKKAADFDGVFLHKKKLNFVDAFWLHRYSKKIIYSFDDAIMYSDKSPELYSRSHMIPFRRSVKLADMVTTGSSYLAEHAQRFNPNVEVLPIGLKVSDYRPDCRPKVDGKIRLVWIGSKSTLGYLAEIKPALEEIGARFDNVILRIICDDFFDLQNLPVEKRLWSQDTRGTDLATSDIGLAPLPDNRFTRGKCSFKVLEYSAAGLPVIASPVGTNSTYVCDHVTGFLVADMREWIDRIAQLIGNLQLRKKMGQAGIEQAANFDIEVIGKKLCNLITECITKDKLK
ncbi:MAG TPA: glycosyltransferase family 4 protein [Sedimentisphaerales bacterium]|nr:glycosyltransferase family 4 protein [Sedimentisphaerales bacterium]